MGTGWWPPTAASSATATPPSTGPASPDAGDFPGIVTPATLATVRESDHLVSGRKEDEALVGREEPGPAAVRRDAGQATGEPEGCIGDVRPAPGRPSRWRSGSWRAILFA